MALQGWTHGGNFRQLSRSVYSANWSILTWVYPTSAPAAYATPLCNRDSGLCGIMRSGAANVWTCDFVGLASAYQRNTGLSCETNKWQLLVGTYAARRWTHVSSSLNTMYKCADGSISSDSWTDPAGAFARTRTNWVQYDPVSGGRQFVGRIALTAIWACELSADDIAELYNGGAGNSPLQVQRGSLVICNYFNDTQLGLDGDLAGASYTNFGTLTTVDGPFTAETPAQTSPFWCFPREYGKHKPAAVQMDHAHPLARGLAGAWPMAEGFGGATQVRDVSGRGLHFDSVGLVRETSPYGAAIRAPSYINYARYKFGQPAGQQALAFDGSEPISISCIFNATDAGGIFAKRSGGSGANWAIDTFTNTFRFYFSNAGWHVWSVPITYGKWYHAVATYNRLTSGCRIWLDGVEQTVTRVAGSGLPANDQFQSTYVYMCNWYGSSTSDAFAGSIAGINLWRRELNDGDVRSLTRDPWGMFQRQLPVGRATHAPTNPFWCFPSQIWRERPRAQTLCREHGLAKGLVGAWYCDGGNSLVDATGRFGRTNLIAGFTTTTAYGRGHTINVAGDPVLVLATDPFGPNVSMQRSFSMGAWVRPNTAGDGTAAEVACFVSTDGDSPVTNHVFLVRRSGNGGLVSQYDLNGNNDVYSWPAASVPAGWHHVMLTRDYVGGVATHKVYLDGVHVGTGSHAGVPDSADYIDAFGIGLSVYGWEGQIDLPVLYDRALAADEVMALYQDPWGMFQRRLPAVRVAAPSTTQNIDGVLGDSATLSETLQARRGRVAAAVDGFLAAAVATPTVGVLAGLDDSATLAATATAAAGKLAGFADSATLAATATAAAGKLAAATSAAAISELLVAQMSRPATAEATARLNDAATTQLGRTAVAESVVAVAAGAASQSGLIATAEETVQLNAAATAQAGLQAAFDDTLVWAVKAVATGGSSAAAQESTTFATAGVAVLGAAASAAAGLTLADVATAAAGVTAVAAAGVTTADTLTATAGFPTTAAAGVMTTDTAGGAVGTQSVVSDSTTMTGGAAVTVGVTAVSQDVWLAATMAAASLGATTASGDMVVIAASVVDFVGAQAAASSGVTAGAAAGAAAGRLAVATDTTLAAAIVSVSQGVLAAASDSLSLLLSVTHSVSAHVQLSEAVKIACGVEVINGGDGGNVGFFIEVWQ